VEVEVVLIGHNPSTEVLEVLVVVELGAKDQLRQQMELQILEVVVVAVLTLVEPHPTRHWVERVVQVLL
jgi:hypothetical protein